MANVSHVTVFARMFACLLGLVWLALGSLCGLVRGRLGWSLGGSALEAFFGSLPGAFGEAKKYNKNDAHHD